MQRLIAFIFVNTIQYSRTLKSNIYHSNKRGTPSCFHSDTNPVIDHALVHSVDKTYVLVVTVELIWLLFLNILSFNFVPIPRKSLRFTRFGRSYENHPVVVLTLNSTHQVKKQYNFDSGYHCTFVARMLLTPRWSPDE